MISHMLISIFLIIVMYLFLGIMHFITEKYNFKDNRLICEIMMFIIFGYALIGFIIFLTN